MGNVKTTKQTFYNIMSSNAKSDILSVAIYLLSSIILSGKNYYTLFNWFTTDLNNPQSTVFKTCTIYVDI